MNLSISFRSAKQGISSLKTHYNRAVTQHSERLFGASNVMAASWVMSSGIEDSVLKTLGGASAGLANILFLMRGAKSANHSTGLLGTAGLLYMAALSQTERYTDVALGLSLVLASGFKYVKKHGAARIAAAGVPLACIFNGLEPALKNGEPDFKMLIAAAFYTYSAYLFNKVGKTPTQAPTPENN